MNHLLGVTALAIALALPGAARAQDGAAPALAVPWIMRGPELVGSPPQAVRWSDDGRWVFFRWRPGGRPWSEPPALYRVRADGANGGVPERLSDAAADSLGPIAATEGDVARDRRWRVVAFRGDLYRIDRRTLAVLRLTRTRATESDPVLSGDARTVFFLRADAVAGAPTNVFALDLATGALRQLTDLRAGTAPDSAKAEGQRRYLEEEQKQLFEHIRVQAALKAHEDSLNKAREALEPKPAWIAKDERVMGLAVDPAGRWAVLEVGRPAPDTRQAIVPDWVILHTSEAAPVEQHAYALPLGGGTPERLTAGTGWEDVVPSPDGQRLAIAHSESNAPPELYLAEARGGAAMRRLTTSPAPEWLARKWVQPGIVRFTASDGVQVPARIFRPSDVGARPNGAAVLFVHGAGYLHEVTRGWSSYHREYMFHHLLAERGFTVLDADYRGSAGYGRDWRTAIYRHMGGRDLDDQVDAAAWLVKNEHVDPARIGIYGGSYGGFITLMALFTSPDTFAAGAALRPVTDWSHYNHGYTSNILNEPQTDPEAYRKSSPIYFAEGLKSALLICHGMVDTNVFFQDTVRLVQRLIELRKENWQVAMFPVENHGFEDDTSWADEYKRILKLFEDNLKDGRRTS